MRTAIYLIAMSFPTGILIGMTGIGGAALMTPLLILIVGIRPDLAIGTDLAYGAITKVVGARVHWKLGHVDMRVVRQLASASLPGGALGTLAMVSLERGAAADVRLKTIIGIVLLTTAVAWLFQKASAGSADDKPRWLAGSRLTVVTFVYGAIIGFLVGLTSIGSGSLILPFLIFAHRLPVLRAVGTDIFHAAILAGFAAILHAGLGGVQWELLPWLLIGSIPGVTIGSRLAPRVPHLLLRAVIIAMLLLAGVKLIG